MYCAENFSLHARLKDSVLGKNTVIGYIFNAV